MSLGYCILAHNRPDRVARLVRQLSGHVFIHYDLHQPKAEHRQIRHLESDTVHIVPPIKCWWGGYSLVEAEMRAMKMASNFPWAHWVNLSGECFPLKSQDEIRSLLKPNISYMDHEFRYWGRPDLRSQNFWLELPFRRKATRVPFFRWNRFAEYFMGSQWHILSREFCEWLIRDPYRGKFKYTGFADEAYFQTAMSRSPFFGNVEGRERMPHDLPVPQSTIVGFYRYFDYNDQGVRVLDVLDYENLVNSGSLFARKVSDQLAMKLAERTGDRKLKFVSLRLQD